MLSFKEINELIKTVDASNVDELELEGDALRLVIRKRTQAGTAPDPSVAPAVSLPQASSTSVEPVGASTAAAPEKQPSTATAADSRQVHRILSPMVGTFYRASSPDKPPFVRVGDQVNEKTVVCILEAMKLMNELEAECSGEIVEILAENGQLVEYGQPLFLVRQP